MMDRRSPQGTLTVIVLATLLFPGALTADDTLLFGRLLLSDEQRLDAEAERQGRPAAVASERAEAPPSAPGAAEPPVRLQGVLHSSRGREHQWWESAGEVSPRGSVVAGTGVVRLEVEGRDVAFRVGQLLEASEAPLREIYQPPAEPASAAGTGGGAGGAGTSERAEGARSSEGEM